MLKNKHINFTPVSNIFIEKYMPNARGEFVKVYLLLLKYNVAGEMGVSSSIISANLNILESDVINAINYWNDEGVIELVPIDKMGNFNIEFIDLSKEDKTQNKEVNLLEALNNNSRKDLLADIERLLGRPLSPVEMTNYLSWEEDYNLSTELTLLLLEYYIQRGKTDYRYLNKIAQSWHEMKITTLEQAQHYITMNEDKWAKIRHILKYLGINNTEIMKPQEKMLEKWIMEFNFPIPVIEEACNRCFKRLNRAEFKYIDGILSNWNKNNLKTLEAIAEKENKLSPSSINKSNYTSNNSKRMNNSNINVTAAKAHDTLEQELLGWYDND